MKFETIFLGITLMIICATFVTLFLKAFYHKKFKNTLIYKGLASICFVIFGGVNFFIGEFSWVKLALFIGLALGIVGDEILALCQIYPERDTVHFLGGGVFFVIGHVFYIAAMLMMNGPNWIAVIISFIVLISLSFVYNSKRKFFIGSLKNSLVLYISIVIFFAAVGVSTFLKHGSIGSALLARGGVLFVISDNILFAFKFGEKPRYFQNIALHVAYYLAQIMIAWSIALI